MTITDAELLAHRRKKEADALETIELLEAELALMRDYLANVQEGIRHLTGEQATTVLCPTCKGAGREDSCFDCGNHGYIEEEVK